MLTRNDLKISTEAELDPGVSGAGVCIRRGACALLESYGSLFGNVERVDGVG